MKRIMPYLNKLFKLNKNIDLPFDDACVQKAALFNVTALPLCTCIATAIALHGRRLARFISADPLYSEEMREIVLDIEKKINSGN